MATPRRSGPWRELYSPATAGNYVNDHALVRDNGGTWHLFGITGTTGIPSQERFFTHGSGPSLEAPLTETGTVIDDGSRAWAPAVFPDDEGVWHLVYGPAPTRRAVSHDLASNEWWDEPVELVGVPMFAVHRDHYVLRMNDHTWLMYATGLHRGRSSIAVLVSNDLRQWRFVQFALTSDDTLPLQPAWGAFESPCVVRIDDTYHLFTTYTDCRRENYHQTLVLTSTNPYDFGHLSVASWDDTVRTVVDAHAPEVVQDPVSGDWFVTSAGWRDHGTHVEGGVAIAPLAWD